MSDENVNANDNKEQEVAPSKIHVDSDWKAQAQAEKEKLAQAEEKVAQKVEDRKMPEADFKGLMGILASQALLGLGAQTDPSGKGVMVDLQGAKYTIDLLAMLEEKTAGNLSEEEATELKQVIQELQSRFVQIAQMVESQMEEGNVSTPLEESANAGGIIDPTS